MPSINPDMLKQLLDGFNEQEATNLEEIRLIEEQIRQLEHRVDICRSRVSSIGSDQQRVLEMMQHYGGGALRPASVRQRSDRSESSPVAYEEPLDQLQSLPASAPSGPMVSEDQPPASKSAPVKSPPAAKASGKTKSAPPAANPVEPEELPTEKPDNQMSDKGEPEEDTVKSINDALRGLFR